MSPSSATSSTAKPARSAWIDTARGACLVVMMAAHMPANRWLEPFWWIGFAPIAEIFVFLAGISCALSWRSARVKNGDVGGRRRIWRRSLDIYLAHVLVFVLAFAAVRSWPDWTMHWPVPVARRLDGDFATLALGVLLLSRPMLFDILPMYCLFLVVAPLVLEQFARGRVVVVVALGVLSWLVAQTDVIESLLHRVPAVQLGYFDVTAWQLMFLAGLVCGYAQADPDFLRALRAKQRGFVIAAVVVVIAFEAARFFTPLGHDTTTWRGMLRPNLGAVRVVMFAAVAILASAVARRLGPAKPGALALLGRHSLQVFSFSVVVCVAAFPLWLLITPALTWPITAAACASLWIPALLNERRRRALATAATAGATPAPAPAPAPAPHRQRRRR